LGTVAVVVGIESYQFTEPPRGMHGVEFAVADARDMASVLSDAFDIGPNDLYLWLTLSASACWVAARHALSDSTSLEEFE
jgi:hypothetical protein